MDKGRNIQYRQEQKWWLQPYVLIPLALSAIMAIIYGLDQSMGLDLYQFGVYPKKGEGLIGLISAPLVHGSFEHLRNNLISFTVLSAALWYFYPRKALPLLILAWIFSGLAIWIWGRPSYHIGASGIIYALAAFIFFSGLLRAHPNLLALSMLVVFLYGSMVWGLVPIEPGVSHEAHISGAIIGVVMAIYLRNSPPKDFPKPFRYDDINDDLSEQIEKYGPNYWQVDHDSQQSGMKIHYEYKSNDTKD